uniref:Chordin n=1 Tax=Lygus hesperus TaxID=30085 RepID=A0A0A9W7Q8_LYGHE
MIPFLGKTHCTYKGHKIELNKHYYPKGECIKLTCEADPSGKRVEGLDGMSCSPQVAVIYGEKGKKFIEPQPSLDLKYPKCCPVKYVFVPDNTKKHNSGNEINTLNNN